YGGYIGAPRAGHHVIGASFQKWLTTTETRTEDNYEILEKLNATIPGLDLGISNITTARAALRCAARDRFPVIGIHPEHSHQYITTAHGSHGILSAMAGANLLADLIDRSPACLPRDSINALSPQRFLDRAAGHKAKPK